MYTDNQILIYDFAWAISEVVDLASPALNNHHKRVSYIAGSLARQMGLPSEEVQDIILAAMLHDIGAFYKEEKDKILQFESLGSDLIEHTCMGYELLKGFEPFSNAAKLIRHHHTDCHDCDDDVPLGSEVIHLADKVSVLFDRRREVLRQVPGIMERVYEKSGSFHPEAVAALEQLAPMEYFWIDAASPLLQSDVMKMGRMCKTIVDLKTLRNFAGVVSHIIDFRSRFTATHSSGVAAVAKELCVLSGFSEKECDLMEIAGLLHDLGKLAVPNDILEKNGKLDPDEIKVVRKHTYYTYAILIKIRGLETIAGWAAYHHERLDGKGYPFHIQGGDFSKLARIMAVADILTAVTEDRPYRPGMDREKAEKVLLNMVSNNGIDKSVVDVAIEHFVRVNDIRAKAQQAQAQDYEGFQSIAAKCRQKKK